MEQNQLAETIYKTVSALFGPDDVVELRILKTRDCGTVSGYFNDKIKLAERAAHWNGRNNIYVTLNPVNPDLLARANNRTKQRASDTTQDADIPRRRFILIDADPERPKGVSATDAEHAAAFEMAHAIKAFLMDEHGFPDMFVADSGNGAHLVIPVDLPNDAATTQAIKNFLLGLGKRFDNEAVKVDKVVYNASRIIKLWGTKAVKGDNMPDRPHRNSRLLHIPEVIQ